MKEINEEIGIFDIIAKDGPTNGILDIFEINEEIGIFEISNSNSHDILIISATSYPKHYFRPFIILMATCKTLTSWHRPWHGFDVLHHAKASQGA
ncbi:unnamed protein product [Prunus brigantina]